MNKIFLGNFGEMTNKARMFDNFDDPAALNFPYIDLFENGYHVNCWKLVGNFYTNNF